MSTLVVASVFLGLIGLRVVLLTVGGALLIRPVRDCPACFHPTTPVLVPWLARSGRFQWRWCTHCGWRGLGKAT